MAGTITTITFFTMVTVISFSLTVTHAGPVVNDETMQRHQGGIFPCHGLSTHAEVVRCIALHRMDKIIARSHLNSGYQHKYIPHTDGNSTRTGRWDNPIFPSFRPTAESYSTTFATDSPTVTARPVEASTVTARPEDSPTFGASSDKTILCLIYACCIILAFCFIVLCVCK